MIPLLGIGVSPAAIVALFLYSFPAHHPQHQYRPDGISHCPSASPPKVSWGFRRWPASGALSRPGPWAILGGIKTSAVINVGTATLGAIIGAGGYGQPILTGIRLDNYIAYSSRSRPRRGARTPGPGPL